MIGSSQLFIRWAVWLLGSAVGLYFIGQSVLLIAGWLRSEKASASEPFSSEPGIATRGLLPSIAGLLARTIESRTLFLVIGLLVGTTYGWVWRDRQAVSSQQTYQKEHAAWQARSVDYQHVFAAWMRLYSKELKP